MVRDLAVVLLDSQLTPQVQDERQLCSSRVWWWGLATQALADLFFAGHGQQGVGCPESGRGLAALI